jgi:hypothetical protein
LFDANSQPTCEEISTIIPAFWALLRNLSPEKVLVCSKRMWNNWLSGKDEHGSSWVQDISANGRKSTIWRYQRSPGIFVWPWV